MITPARQAFTVTTSARGVRGAFVYLSITGMRGHNEVEVMCRYASHLRALGFTEIQTVTAKPISTLKLN